MHALTHKFAKLSKSTNKSLGRKSNRFLERSNRVRCVSARNVSLWSVVSWLDERSLCCIQTSVEVTDEERRRKLQFNKIVKNSINFNQSYIWLMSLGIDCVAGTDFKLRRKQLICLRAGKHLEKRVHKWKITHPRVCSKKSLIHDGLRGGEIKIFLRTCKYESCIPT